MTTIEKDEELEKLIQMESEGCKNACRTIWRISARMAREKAIEECIRALPQFQESPSTAIHIGEKAVKESATVWNWAIETCVENLAKLKPI